MTTFRLTSFVLCMALSSVPATPLHAQTGATGWRERASTSLFDVRAVAQMQLQTPPARPQLRTYRCSMVKAVIIGAAVGFGAGAVYGVTIAPKGNFLYSTSDLKNAGLYGLIGAASGAAIGTFVCR